MFKLIINTINDKLHTHIVNDLRRHEVGYKGGS